MFDGIPDVVTLEEPHQGVQFGVDERLHPAGPGPEFEVPTRDGQPAAGPVPFRAGAPGVVDAVALAPLLGAGDSAQLAQRLLQFPFRQVFGPTHAVAADPVPFRPQIALETVQEWSGEAPE